MFGTFEVRKPINTPRTNTNTDFLDKIKQTRRPMVIDYTKPVRKPAPKPRLVGNLVIDPKKCEKEALKQQKQMKDLFDQCILNGGKKLTPEEKVMKQITDI